MTPSFKTIDKAICAAFVPNSFESHQMICMFHGNYYLVPKDKIPPGYTKLKLHDITILLHKEFEKIQGHDKKKLADALGYMGNRQVKTSFSGCCGLLRKILWFFNNLFRGYIGKTPSAKAFELQNRLLASAPPSALRKELITEKKPTIETVTQAAPAKQAAAPSTIPSSTVPVVEIPKDAFKAHLIIPRKPKEATDEFNKRVYADTMHASFSGYVKNNQFVPVDNVSMLKNTQIYGGESKDVLPPLTDNNTFKTTFTVSTEDTLNVLLKHKRQGANPVALVLANGENPGGGLLEGHSAQEEDLCRRSSLEMGLSTQKYPLPEVGGIYCPDVPVFREDAFNGYAFMDAPEKVCFVAAAACDLRGLKETQLTYQARTKDKKYIEATQHKILNMLFRMAFHGHDTIVLGAFGCGVFKNNPLIISTVFQWAFEQPIFKGRFKHVDFAIFDNDNSDNVRAFKAKCEELNKKQK